MATDHSAEAQKWLENDGLIGAWAGPHQLKIIDRLTALLTRVAAIAVTEGCPRLEWSVLDWNQPSIDFYHSLGAVMKSQWKTMQVSGKALPALAEQSK